MFALRLQIPSCERRPTQQQSSCCPILYCTVVAFICDLLKREEKFLKCIKSQRSHDEPLDPVTEMDKRLSFSSVDVYTNKILEAADQQGIKSVQTAQDSLNPVQDRVIYPSDSTWMFSGLGI